jgi:Fe-S-cluster containining protein
MFNCEHCGCCCRNLDKSEIYASLDRGDGVCKYLEGNDCSIYNNRPLLCRIDESYDYMFSSIMPRDEFYRINKQACKKLRKLEE